MAGKSKTPEQRRAMRERCEKIAAKYRGSDENTTGWGPERVPDYSQEVAARHAAESTGSCRAS